MAGDAELQDKQKSEPSKKDHKSANPAVVTPEQPKSQLDQVESINFDQQMPGSKGGKPDSDEMEMMKDIMGNDMMTDEEQPKKKTVKKQAPKKNSTALSKGNRPHDHLNIQ